MRWRVLLRLTHCPSPASSETEARETDSRREYLCLQCSGESYGRFGRRHPCCEVVSIDDSLGILLLLIHVKYKCLLRTPRVSQRQSQRKGREGDGKQ